MLLSASLIWGVACVAQSAGMSYVGPYTFTAVRSALAAIGLGVLILILDKTSLKSKNTDKKVLWRAGIILGVVMTIATIWIKPLITRFFQARTATSAGQRTKIGEKIVQFFLVLIVAFIVWILVVLFSRDGLTGLFRGRGK